MSGVLPSQEIASPNWIAQPPFLIAGENNKRNTLRFHRSNLGNRKLPGRENFEWHYFKAVVYLIELIDQEDAGPFVLERAHQRSQGKEVTALKIRMRTTDSNHALPIAPNLLARNFAVDAPNTVWAGDMTYIPTAEGWLYLAVVLDLFSRRIVGWSMGEAITAELAGRAHGWTDLP